MGIGYNFDGDQNQSKNGVRPKCREKAKKIPTLTQTHNKCRKKSNSIPGTREKTKKSYFRTKFVLKKKNYDFQVQKVFQITFSEGNGREEVEEINSNGTFVCDDDADKVVLCTRSPFSVQGGSY